MIDQHSRRDVLKTTAKLAAGALIDCAHGAVAKAAAGPSAFAHVDALLRTVTEGEAMPGIVALAATDKSIVYEGAFGRRNLPDGPAMTGDTVFRVASMIKPITTVAALQLVERGRLSLDSRVPDIDPVLGSPQVFDGIDATGRPVLRPARRPILLRHLLTHTAGLSYRLWDREAVRYSEAIGHLPPEEKSRAPRALMFDPGERWQYGPNLDWVGRIVELVSGERLDIYFRKHIFDPLGMRDTGFVLSDQQRAREASVNRRGADGMLMPQPLERQVAKHSFSGGGGIYSTAPDYLTFLRMLLQGGTFRGARILNPNTVALMGRNQIGDIEAGVLRTTVPALSGDLDLFPGTSLRWGFGHMINMQAVPNGRSAGSMGWAGLLNTFYWIDPKKLIAAVFMTQVLPFADDRAVQTYRQFETGIYAAMRAN